MSDNNRPDRRNGDDRSVLFSEIDAALRIFAQKGYYNATIDEIPVILEVLFNGFVGESQTREHFFPVAEDKLRG